VPKKAGIHREGKKPVEIHPLGRIMAWQQRIFAMEALMNTRLILAASLALVLAGPAFAQDSYSTPPTDEVKTTPPIDDALTDDADQKTTDETPMASDAAAADEGTEAPAADVAKTDEAKPEAPLVVETATITRISGTAAVLAPSVAPIISDSAPQPVAANVYDPRKDLMAKVYPTVDKGHVEGDPPVIDHSADIMPVSNPTTSVANIPTGD
jgi:hypothetical protein